MGDKMIDSYIHPPAELRQAGADLYDEADFWFLYIPMTWILLLAVFYKYFAPVRCCGDQPQHELETDENGIAEIPSDDEKKEEHSNSEQEIALSSRQLVRSGSAPQLTNTLRRRRGRSQIPQNADRAPAGSLRRTLSAPIEPKTSTGTEFEDDFGNCDFCKKSNVKVAFCKGCNAVMYCSRDCQISHWKTHKPHCKKLRKNTKSKVVVPQTELECVD